MATQMQQRRDTAANWTSSNPTLAAGEIGYETDTLKMKLGDGSTAWTSLEYYTPRLNPTPVADYKASGTIIKLKSCNQQSFGDACFLTSDGEAKIANASGIASAMAFGVCADVSAAASATTNYLLHGIARRDSWAWTVGGAIYLSTSAASAATLTQTAPSGTDECIVVLGVATHADRILLNPSYQGIVEHV